MHNYRWRFLCPWLFTMAIFATSLVLLPLAIHSFASHNPERGTAYTTAAVAMLAFFIYARLPAQRLRLRIGIGFCGHSTDAAPATLRQLRSAAQSFRQKGTQPTMVGGGWSNVLAWRTARGPCLLTRHLTGTVPGTDDTVWYAGTQLVDANRVLAKRGLQLINVPSYGCVTMGAWVATMGHGMTGGKFTHGLLSVRARVLDLRTGIETDDGPEMLLEKFGRGAERAAQFLVLTIDIGNSPTLVANGVALREGRWVRGVDDAAWALGKDAAMMVLFVGRRKTLCLRWTPQPIGAAPVKGGGALMDLQLALFATLGRGLGDPSGRGRSEKLSAGVLLFDLYLYPIFIFFYLLLGIANFEVYTSDVAIAPALLLSLATSLQPVHRKHGGRTEIRVLGKLLFLDCFAYGRAGQRAMLATLSAHGVGKVALHPGKFAVRREDVADAGLALISSHEVARSLKQ